MADAPKPETGQDDQYRRWINGPSAVVHTCGVCFLTANEHPYRCYIGETMESHDHMLPLCCSGCLCGSFEESHPGPWARVA